MVFFIIIALIVIIPFVVAANSRSYDRGENYWGTLCLSVFAGGMLFGFFSLAGYGAHNTVKSETTYTVAENSSTVYENGDLTFAYTEDGKIQTWSGDVAGSTIPVETPKEIKIVGRDSVVPWIAPWPLGYSETAEFSK